MRKENDERWLPAWGFHSSLETRDDYGLVMVLYYEMVHLSFICEKTKLEIPVNENEICMCATRRVFGGRQFDPCRRR